MANQTDPRPNLLLFMPDQLGADAVSGQTSGHRCDALVGMVDLLPTRCAQRTRPDLAGRDASVRTDRRTEAVAR